MNPTAPTSPPEPGSGWRRERWPVLWALLAGALLGVLPHLVRLWNTGDPTWLSDIDELVPYGQQISFAQHQHPWRLGDPAFASGGASVFPWIQFGPYLLGAKALGTGTLGTFILMRLWAGASMALGCYLLLRILRPGWLSAAIAVLLVSDQGLKRGIPFLDHFRSVLSILRDQPLEKLHEWSAVLPHLRLISPGISLFSLLLAVALLVRLQSQPTTRRAIHAGLGLGLCIATYLYFWTALVIAIGFLALLQPSRWRLYFIVLALGGCVGSPALLQNFLTKLHYGDEWLVRNEYFVPVLVRTWDLPKLALALYAITAPYAFRIRPQLLPVWLTGFASILLSQSHHLTGILLQPFHWLMAPGPLVAILLFHAAADAWRKWGTLRIPAVAAATAIATLTIAQFTGALLLRGWATDHNQSASDIEQRRQQWLAFLKDNPGLALVPNAVIAGDHLITDWTVLHQGLRPLTGTLTISPSVKDAQWLRRRVLNAWLKGYPESAVQESAWSEHGVWFELGRMDDAARARQMNSMRETWRDIHAQPGRACDEFSVRYLMTAAGADVPSHVREGWRLIASNPAWELRERPMNPR
jgi:hypothetical protein